MDTEKTNAAGAATGAAHSRKAQAATVRMKDRLNRILLPLVSESTNRTNVSPITMAVESKFALIVARPLSYKGESNVWGVVPIRRLLASAEDSSRICDDPFF